MPILATPLVSSFASRPADEERGEFLLEVNHLRVSFDTEDGVVRAVDDVSFTLRKGETVGIVGESGSGKSVTALSLMRLLPSPPGRMEGGEIWFHSPRFGSLDLAHLPPADMRNIRGNEMAMVFQEPMSSLNPVFTCGNQVMEAVFLHQDVSRKEAKRLTIEAFKQVRLPRPESIFHAYPHEISGGQKQRVMIAMALSCNPAVLIADEPTTALDVTVQATVLDLLRQLRDEKGTSILFITHDLGVVAEMADRVLVMYRGKIVEQGSVWDVFADPKHPYTKGLLACRPRLDLRMNVLPTVADFMEVDADGTIREKPGGYASVGESLLLNFVTDEEINERQAQLAKQPPILRVKDLKTYFPLGEGFFGQPKEWVRAVDGVSFDVYPGETLGLVGESGCGKTTLGRSILRLIEPQAGEIYFEGRDIRQLGAREMRALRKDLQIVFQDPYSSLNPRIPIGEAIMEPMRLHGMLASNAARKDKVIELLETVNLKAEYFYRYAHEFSGGQRQRICIARTLALHPKFIICDEPVSALDVSVQAQVLNLLNDLKKKFNFTYVFISHDLSVVKFMADRLLVMNKGRIEEMGYAEEVYANPRSDYTRALIGAIPKSDLESVRQAQWKRKGKAPDSGQNL
ncbi:MAG: ABC transporter ATP-binding protein [Ferruginibacter sp.]|nr:ABC transporter ATP-binding protein [Cytophagales bacterium]